MPNRPRRPFLVLAIIALLTTPRPASAERQTGPWVDLPVCTVPGWRFGPALISDGRQGVIVAGTTPELSRTISTSMPSD